MSCVRDFLVLFSVFVRQKVTITENITFADCFRNPASRLLQIGQKSEKWQWRHNFPTWRQITIFWRWFVSLVKFSYWSKFHVNIITSSGFMTIFFHKGLTRNPEIGNAPVWVLPNIWRLGKVMDTKFATNISNKILLHTAKFQGYNSYRFWVIKGKPTGAKIKPPTQARVKCEIFDILFSYEDEDIGRFSNLYQRTFNRLKSSANCLEVFLTCYRTGLF